MKSLFAAAVFSGFLATAAQAAPTGVKAGVLDCAVAPGVGLILGSSKAVHCTFNGNNGVEHYDGNIGKLGVDIGVTTSEHLVWAVFAPGELHRGALAGRYIGASAQATVIAGLGANVLVGGWSDSVNLQPVSVQGQTGLNVAAGLADLSLHTVGGTMRHKHHRHLR